MPHFELGAFNHSATSPEGQSLSDAARYVTAAGCRDKLRFAGWFRLQFPADFAVERIRPAAAQRDGKADQAPQQYVFITALEPGEAVAGLPIGHEDEQHLDRRGGGKDAGEQPEDERDPAQELDGRGPPEPDSGWREAHI